MVGLFSPCHCTNLRRAARAVSKVYDTAIEPSGLRITQLSLLRNLQRLGPVSMSTLSEALMLERTGLIRNLSVLAKQGLVESVSDRPPKAGTIRLTPQGETVVNETAELWDAAQKKIETVLTKEEQAVFQRILLKLQSVA